MTQTGFESSEGQRVSFATRRISTRERKRKATSVDYFSDDSAVGLDLNSDTEYSETSKVKRSKPGGTRRVVKEEKKEEGGGCDGGSRAAPTADLAVKDGEKLLMRQWLLKQADEQTIPGLYWYDEAKTQIRIPWKHGSRTGWTIEDCRVYREWAVHTGKIACITEPKKWKANFRCALNSLPDVTEVIQLCQKRGSDPYKIYKMLPEVPRKSLAKKTKPCKTERLDEEPCDLQQISLPDIQIKGTETVNNPVSLNGFLWPYGNNVVCSIKTEEPDTPDSQFSQPLIPTVVEELSEQPSFEAPVLTSLESYRFMDAASLSQQLPTSSSLLPPPSLPSPSLYTLSMTPLLLSPNSSPSMSCSSSSDDSAYPNEIFLDECGIFKEFLDDKLALGSQFLIEESDNISLEGFCRMINEFDDIPINSVSVR